MRYRFTVLVQTCDLSDGNWRHVRQRSFKTYAKAYRYRQIIHNVLPAYYATIQDNYA